MTVEATQDAVDGDPVVTKASPLPVPEVVDRLVAGLGARGVTVFAVIDQAAEARRVGLELRDTVLVVFGNPAAGTPVMAASPLAALDLPLKVLVWDDGGRTAISYRPPSTTARRFGVAPDVVAPLESIGPLTDAAAGTGPPPTGATMGEPPDPTTGGRP